MPYIPARSRPGVVIDWETCSEGDLRRQGATRYARDCLPIVLAYRMPGRAARAGFWMPGMPPPNALLDWVRAGGLVKAWNVPFDRAVWNAHAPGLGWPVLPIEQTECIMSRALYWGLPGSLDLAGNALGLPALKSKTGHGLMLRMARPRGFDPVTHAPRWWHEEDPEKLNELLDYCVQDVEVECWADSAIPDLPRREREVWLRDQHMNDRGIELDRRLITAMQAAASQAMVALDAALDSATGGAVQKTTQTTKLLAYLHAAGYPHGDLQKDTILQRLAQIDAEPATPKQSHEREVLALRREAARTSTAKLNAMVECMDPDDLRARDQIQFYGAGRTGRWAGRLIQPHNMPRGTIKRVGQAVAMILKGFPPSDLEVFFSDSAMGILASCLRACMIAGPGKKLIVADKAQIEARVLPWLAGQQDMLDVFRSGEDVYMHEARRMGPEATRQHGKVNILGLGFGCGPTKFITVAAGYGIRMTWDESYAAVHGWRKRNAKTVQFWWDCDQAFKAVLKAGPGKLRDVGRVAFETWREHALVHLPAGRSLVYREAQIAWGKWPDGRDREEIQYLGVDQRTHKWAPQRTYAGKIAENITQAVARDTLAGDIETCEHHPLISPLMSVHDEVIAEADESRAVEALAAMLTILRTPPVWAPDLPVGAEGNILDRYTK